MPVDRCVCHTVPFTELKQLADAGTDSFDDLSMETGCGTGCGMCEPYVRLMLKTGQTSFPVMPPHELDRALRDDQHPRPHA
ncbi:MAG: (2Fe-2S)-binding protein [Planctomycetota bacterium]